MEALILLTTVVSSDHCASWSPVTTGVAHKPVVLTV